MAVPTASTPPPSPGDTRAPSVVEPPRPSRAEVAEELTAHVRALAGPNALPRPEQVDAVTAVVADRQRTLLVARTGFGKSAVYFSATAMLRARGWGPTVVISPLLALMRDQVAAAERLGLTAVTINSSNVDAWDDLEARLTSDEVDLLLIAPERLANPGFRRRVFDSLRSRAFTLVCDEAHCISDWGHDFRPDYRRLRRLLAEVPPWTPVLATTATANARVTEDVAAQLGDDTLVLRTSLDRGSLRLSVVDLPDDAHRLAWLSERFDELPGSGIVYCLTVDQAETTARWLRDEGHDAAAYTGSVEPDDRLRLEEALRANKLKALVATSALGMGFDKGDLAFCVHLGLPPSPVAYYQQIGRAGRSLDTAEVIALPRPSEDAAIWRWFESVSLPSEELCRSTLDQLDLVEPTSIAILEHTVNLGRNRLGTLMNILEVDGAVERVGGGWIRTRSDWAYNHALATNLRELRRAESEQMRTWAELDGCRLRYLREALDDAEAGDCGRCDRCTDSTWQSDPDPEGVARAQQLLRGGDVIVPPRKQWPSGLGEPKGRIAADRQPRPGRALARLGDGGWGPVIERLVSRADAGTEPTVELNDDLLWAIAGILKRWDWQARPTWICPMPSRRRRAVIDAVADGLGELGRLPVHRALTAGSGPRASPEAFQADQANSAHQVVNVWHRLVVDPAALPEAGVLAGPVLLIDDEIASRWTVTVAAWRLTEAGSGPVLPLALRSR
ncbi:RecQ family ATP-dependent DNA helicase [Candidatus Microthrix parvicella]|uniref:RecQ family ATP-dependent DNA helicase n=1 Tax=Candidatus Neomicrothrix parvicella TaxID=41950 RepID=UPI00038016C5|nr:RecQ family ATP-dependent DNA helicase [Candidatus Microthrix parvicella]